MKSLEHSNTIASIVSTVEYFGLVLFSSCLEVGQWHFIDFPNDVFISLIYISNVRTRVFLDGVNRTRKTVARVHFSLSTDDSII